MFGLFVIFLHITTANAIVINMEELYNPILNQTIILMGDIHSPASKIDEQQYNDLVCMVKKYHAHVIIEGTIYNEWWDHRVMLRLSNSAETEYIPIINVEFRKASKELMLIDEQIHACETLGQVKTLFEDERIKSLFFDSFIQMDVETVQIRNEIMEFVGDLKKISHKNMYEKEIIFFLEGLLCTYYSLSKEIKETFTFGSKYEFDKRDQAIEFMINNFFFEREGKVYTSSESIYSKSSDIQTFFLDIRALKHMYMNRDKRLLFVYTGQYHTRHISRILRAIGFDLKSQNSNDVQATGLLKGLHTNNDFEIAFKSGTFAQCDVDVSDFFNNCSSLPQYPEISNSSRIFKLFVGGCVVAAGVWVAYRLLSKMNMLSAVSTTAAMGTAFKANVFTPNQSPPSRDAKPVKTREISKSYLIKTFLGR